ncbi:MAG TPA: hypothetical protein VGR85_05200 [Candidatus Limnocylindria bacterium]|nr:hypothetical protein [Candidatus Limnocylindria bacterium]
MRVISPVLALALIAASLVLSSTPVYAMHGNLSGTVTDIATGQPVNAVCVTIGPPVRCATMTKADGTYFVDLAGAPDGLGWDVAFFISGQQKAAFPGTIVNGPTVVNAKIDATGFVTPPACGPLNAATPTATNYMPNITKTLGGPAGWQTPFIVQNTGTASATLEVSWYKFIDGSCAKRINVTRAPGTSFAYIPNNDSAIPDNTQFSVVVRSYGSTVVSVVNEHQGSGDRAEAMSYDGFSGGTLSVFLPNITRRFFGYVTPFIIQNLGAATTTATAQFQERGGTGSMSVIRVIDPGKSQFVDPNSTLGLVDGKAYAVTVTADQPIAVVVNTHNDASFVANPVAYSADGIAAGAATVYAPYFAKNAFRVGVSTMVVQNVGSASASPSLKFTPLGGGTATTFSLGSVNAGNSAAFDPRYTNGNTTQPLCGATASTGCLGDGEYSVEVTSGGGNIAAAVSVIGGASAMGYTALTQATPKYFLPNVTRTLGGSTGWTTPILIQSTTASGATLNWYRFTDGVLATTQTVPITPGSGVRVDPRNVPGLSDDTQYAVVAQATGGNIAAIVVELANGADNAMIYEGFAQ